MSDQRRNHAAKSNGGLTSERLPGKNRREDLPWRWPKPAEDDPNAPSRVARIMASAGYREADEDLEFLQSDRVRATRLQLDYLKAEIGLERQGVGHAIVVFGSSRIPEPKAAARRLEAARAASAADPTDAARARACRIAERVADNSRYYTVAQDFGRLIAALPSRPPGERVAVMTGGGPGLMEAANRGAWEGGAPSVGLNITLPHEQYPNPYITEDLCFRFHYFALRKLHFLHRARALVAFPGGYGTFDELFETLTLIQTRKIAPLPVALVGRAFWRRAIDFDFLAAEGVIDPEDLDLFAFAETAEEIYAHISDWHRAAGRPILE
jgi:uncharacterized protein (TIGR00730 family)